MNRVREDELSGQTNLIPDGATVHVVSIILFICRTIPEQLRGLDRGTDRHR